jgi:hypothetical protein
LEKSSRNRTVGGAPPVFVSGTGGLPAIFLLITVPAFFLAVLNGALAIEAKSRPEFPPDGFFIP